MIDLMPTGAGNAPAVIKTQTVLVYSGADGRIVHQHEVITLAGAGVASDAQVAADALDQAGRGGHRPEGLRTLHVDAAALQPRTGYRVDTLTGRLVEETPTS
jgi:hypothetical protein